MELDEDLVNYSFVNLMRSYKHEIENKIIKVVHGNGFKGYPQLAPYDAIYVGAAASSVPKELIKQLKVNGQMLIPIGNETSNYRKG